MLVQTAIKCDVEVKKNGQVAFDVPFPPGAHVTVFVVQVNEPFDDLMNAAESTLGFWDNALDDEDWNNA